MDNTNKISEINNPSKVYALFYAFFLIPLMITIFGVLFFFLFKMLTYEEQDPYHLLNNIQSGALTKRWQSAFELAKILGNSDLVPNDERFVNELKSIYRNSIHDNSEVRTYLALAMGSTGNSNYGDVLLEGLQDKNIQSRIAAIKAVGQVGYNVALSQLSQYIDPSIKK